MRQVNDFAKRLDLEGKKETRKFITLALKNSAIIVHHKESKEAPRGATGKLARSIREIVTELAAIIGPDPSVKYAIYVEKGTKPHMPPVDAISAWAEKKGINPWALAISIKNKGTSSNPFVKRTYEGTKKEVELEFERTTKLMVDFMARRA